MHWRERTPAEREEFVRLFADLLERSYMTKSSCTTASGSATRATPSTRPGHRPDQLVNKQGGEMAVNYRMVNRDERWKVYDVESRREPGRELSTQFNSLLRARPIPTWCARCA